VRKLTAGSLATPQPSETRWKPEVGSAALKISLQAPQSKSLISPTVFKNSRSRGESSMDGFELNSPSMLSDATQSKLSSKKSLRRSRETNATQEEHLLLLTKKNNTLELKNVSLKEKNKDLQL